MCGIAGFVTTKEYAEEAQRKFKRILVRAEARGTDACGIAFIEEKGRFQYAKQAKKASEFLQESGVLKMLEDSNPTILIGHNRAKTQGDQADNNNNHPIVTKTGLILIHNGVLYNEDDIAKEFHLHLDGQVDSEVIVRLIEYYIYTKGKDTMKAIQLMRKHIRGSMAIALLNDKEPKTLYLMASTNPINFAYHIPTGTIYFASTEDILKDGLVEYDSYFHKLFWQPKSQSEYVFKEMADNTGIKITQKGWEEFEVEEPTYTSNNYGSSYNRSDHADYEDDYEPAYNTKEPTPSKMPTVIEAGSREDIVKALTEYKDFDARDSIKKPSLYLSELLLYRLEMIQEDFTTGDYMEWGTSTDDKRYKEVKSEVVRIIDTLTKRKVQTKRADIVVPTLDQIWLLDNKLYGSELKTGAPASDGFKDVKWILTHMNVEAMKNLSKAEKYGKDEEKLDNETSVSNEESLTADEEDMKMDIEMELEDIAREKEERGEPVDYFECETCRQKVFENPCPYCKGITIPRSLGDDVYFCPDCCTIKDRNYCGNCGTINLKTANEALSKNNQLALVN